MRTYKSWAKYLFGGNMKKIIFTFLLIITLFGCSRNYIYDFNEKNNQFEIRLVYREEKENTFKSVFKNNDVFLSNDAIVDNRDIIGKSRYEECI